MKLRTLPAIAALVVAGAAPGLHAQTGSTTAGADAGQYPKGEVKPGTMPGCSQEAAGEAREACLKRQEASGGMQGQGTGTSPGLTDRNNDGRQDGSREMSPGAPGNPPKN